MVKLQHNWKGVCDQLDIKKVVLNCERFQNHCEILAEVIKIVEPELK